jgi:hypothetical protein
MSKFLRNHRNLSISSLLSTRSSGGDLRKAHAPSPLHCAWSTSTEPAHSPAVIITNPSTPDGGLHFDAKLDAKSDRDYFSSRSSTSSTPSDESTSELDADESGTVYTHVHISLAASHTQLGFPISTPPGLVHQELNPFGQHADSFYAYEDTHPTAIALNDMSSWNCEAKAPFVLAPILSSITCAPGSAPDELKRATEDFKRHTSSRLCTIVHQNTT